MPSELDDAPSEQYIRELYEHVSGHGSGGSPWSRQHTLDKSLLELVYDEHAIITPDTDAPDRKRRHVPHRMSTGEAGRIVELIAAFHSPVARIGLMVASSGIEGGVAKDINEQAIQEAIDQLNPHVDAPRPRDVWNQVTLGRCARLGPIQGTAYWWDMPERGENESEEDIFKRREEWRSGAPIPLVWRDLPPESTFPASWGRLNDEVISWLPMTWWEAIDMFGTGSMGNLLPDTADRHQEVTVCIYSNRNHLAYCLMMKEVTGVKFLGVQITPGAPDKIVRRFRHNLGRSAIRILPGAVSGRREDGRYWRSALFQVAPLIKNADRLLTLGGTSIEMDALPVLKRRRFLNPEGEQLATEQTYRAGDIWDVWMDQDTGNAEDIAPVIQSNGATDVLNMVLLLLERTATISGAVEALEGGLGPSGMPAWSKNASIEAAKGKLQPITDGIVNADLDAAEMIISSVVELNEKIDLFNKDTGKVTLDPEKLKGFKAALKADYQLKMPTNWRADFDLGLSAMERGKASGLPIDPFYVMERFMGIEQPFLHWIDSIERAALTSDEMKAYLTGKQFELLATRNEEEQGLTAQEAAQILGEAGASGAAQQVVSRGANGAGPTSAPAGGPTPQQSQVP